MIIKKPSFITGLFLLISVSITAQDNAIVKYYDSLWTPTSKDSAFYLTKFVKQDSFYVCTSYWIKSKKLYARSIFADTTFSRPLGLLLRYYPNGQVEDSTYHYEDGSLKNTYHFYPNGKLWAHYTYDKKNKKETQMGFDESGKPIVNFVYYKEAEFQDGNEGWKNYLIKTVNTEVPVKNGAPLGTYQVIIRFIITTDGKIANVHAETDWGYGMEEEVIRIIKKSPPWRSLIILGKKENAFRRQPLIFVVSQEDAKDRKEISNQHPSQRKRKS